ncbi:MAG: transporter substrate-binding domain-containing protein [Bacillota bacterium]|nr:transporter substrate-binding domain-containing protein [Bacillota bacterium]
MHLETGFLSGRKRALAAVAALTLGLALALGGCGGGGGAAGTAANGGSSTPNIDAIKSRGVLRVGVKADVLGFGYKNPQTNQYEGYEIDIAHELAKRLLGDPNKVELTTVTAKTRQGLLDSGQVDMVIATFTITPERQKVIDFSPVYYTDGIQLLVKRDSGIKSLKDLNGKVIAVAQGADTGQKLQEKAKELGVTIQTAEYASYAEDMAALQNGRAQAFATDGSILKYYENQDPSTVILPDRYSEEPYGIAIKKGNKDLLDFVTKAIDDMKQSGELQQLIRKWKLSGSV